MTALVLCPVHPRYQEFVAAPLTNAKTYDEVLENCGRPLCRLKDRQLAEALAEDLDYKLTHRRYDQMIKEVKERDAGV